MPNYYLRLHSSDLTARRAAIPFFASYNHTAPDLIVGDINTSYLMMHQAPTASHYFSIPKSKNGSRTGVGEGRS